MSEDINRKALRDSQNLETLNAMGKTLEEALENLEDLTRQTNLTVNQMGWGIFDDETKKGFTGAQSQIFKSFIQRLAHSVQRFNVLCVPQCFEVLVHGFTSLTLMLITVPG